MPLHGASDSSTAIERRVRDVITRERMLTFTTLSTALPDCRWINLLRVLNHLEKQHMIRLIPLPWDYQIVATTDLSPAPRTD